MEGGGWGLRSGQIPKEEVMMDGCAIVLGGCARCLPSYGTLAVANQSQGMVGVCLFVCFIA